MTGNILILLTQLLLNQLGMSSWTSIELASISIFHIALQHIYLQNPGQKNYLRVATRSTAQLTITSLYLD